MVEALGQDVAGIRLCGALYGPAYVVLVLRRPASTEVQGDNVYGGVLQHGGQLSREIRYGFGVVLENHRPLSGVFCVPMPDTFMVAFAAEGAVVVCDE